MRDVEFLKWIHYRLMRHGDSMNTDFMSKLRSIIANTPADAETPNTDNEDLRKEMRAASRLWERRVDQ